MTHHSFTTTPSTGKAARRDSVRSGDLLGLHMHSLRGGSVVDRHGRCRGRSLRESGYAAEPKRNPAGCAQSAWRTQALHQHTGNTVESGPRIWSQRIDRSAAGSAGGLFSSNASIRSTDGHLRPQHSGCGTHPTHIFSFWNRRISEGHVFVHCQRGICGQRHHGRRAGGAGTLR